MSVMWDLKSGPGVSEIVRIYLKKWWCRTRNIYLLSVLFFTDLLLILQSSLSNLFTYHVVSAIFMSIEQ